MTQELKRFHHKLVEKELNKELNEAVGKVNSSRIRLCEETVASLA